jgi:dTDP-4-dehydrorhamnose 3,5-epimerase
MYDQIEGVSILSLVNRVDARGSLMELYRLDWLDSIGFGLLPMMGYISMTKPGISRGPHEHKEQTDIFIFIGPSIFRVWLWDGREYSTTHGNKMRFEVGSGKPSLVVVPPRVIHGYQNIGVIDGMVLNFPNQLYGGKGGKGIVDEIRHEDRKDGRYIME